MTKTRLIPLAALAMLSLASGTLAAQSRPTVELAFGYTCGDRFLVRNDGSQPVVIEYAMAGSQDKSQLHLNAKQSAEIASAQNGNMELWVGGKLVASEAKGNRACNGSAPASANDGVVVRPIDPNASQAAPANESTEVAYNANPVVVYGDPYYYPYGWYPSYYGWGYPTFGYYGGVVIGGRGFVGRGRPGIGRGRR